ncbi:MAG: squalene synthase HpnC [Stygiobacter sp.]|uniref:Squalene synthase HpnC n=1 Tax=Stygiobacter electus TaxID=3032292 RepID=A0AAE3P2Q8_9BACT|nr:squalene synthase HpnC [Stygiobacter electus]MDF1611800.1 squalene synthase HpnC [Stygiobacter electus]
MEERINSAYKTSLTFSKEHYENFPVILFSVSKELKKHIAIIYKFARQADDLADEGYISQNERLFLLNEYEKDFIEALNGKFKNDFWLALKNTCDKFQIDKKFFLDLISAFKQDIIKKRYETDFEILDYCKRSANPIGRILLKIFKVEDNEALIASDKICIALQLTNFYQDVSIDIQKNRIYASKEMMRKYSVTEEDFLNLNCNENVKLLFKELIEKTYKMFNEGKVIQSYVPKSFLLQIRMTILGGEKILHKIVENDYDVFNKRPKLNKKDFLLILLKSFRNV